MSDNNKEDKSPYHARDRALKLVFANKIMMEHLIKTFIAGPWAERFDFKSLSRLNIAHITNDLRKRENDVVWQIRFDDEPIYIIIMLEFQSNIDYYMPLLHGMKLKEETSC